MRTKLMTILLSIVMVVTMMPMMAFAETDSFEAPVTAQNEEQLGEQLQDQPDAQPSEALIEQEPATRVVTGEGTEASPWLIGATDEDTVQATLDDGVLTITGNGNMIDFAEGKQPWAGETLTSVYFYSRKMVVDNETVDEKLLSIGNNAFSGFSSITYINKPVYLKKIGNAAFKGCGITTFNMPSYVESIGNDAFENCSRISSIKLPSTLTSIGNNAFKGCAQLKKVEAAAPKAPTLGTGAFDSTHSELNIYVLGDSYNTDTGWSGLTDKMTVVYDIKVDEKISNNISFATSEYGVGYKPGDTVTMYINPEEGYSLVLNSIKVTYLQGDGQQTVQDLSQDKDNYNCYTFTMPAATVSVSAIFEITYVCEIDGTHYKTLAEAVARVKNNGTIKLTADTDKEFIELSRMITFTIVNNGHENNVQMNPARHRKLTVKEGPDKIQYKVSYKLIDRPFQPVIDSITRTVDKIKVKLVDVVGRILKILSRN